MSTPSDGPPADDDTALDKDPSQEDRRHAATLAVGVAASVTTAALAVLGAVAIVVTFVTGKYHRLGVFYALTVVSVGLLVLAVVIGAQGVAEITKNGARGKWTTSTDKRLFDTQAKLAFGGLLCFALAVVVGFTAPKIPPEPSRPDPARYEVQGLRKQLVADEAMLRRVLALASALRRRRCCCHHEEGD